VKHKLTTTTAVVKKERRGVEDTYVNDLEVNSIRWCCSCCKL